MDLRHHHRRPRRQRLRLVLHRLHLPVDLHLHLAPHVRQVLVVPQDVGHGLLRLQQRVELLHQLGLAILEGRAQVVQVHLLLLPLGLHLRQGFLVILQHLLELGLQSLHLGLARGALALESCTDALDGLLVLGQVQLGQQHNHILLHQLHLVDFVYRELLPVLDLVQERLVGLPQLLQGRLARDHVEDGLHGVVGRGGVQPTGGDLVPVLEPLGPVEAGHLLRQLEGPREVLHHGVLREAVVGGELLLQVLQVEVELLQQPVHVPQPHLLHVLHRLLHVVDQDLRVEGLDPLLRGVGHDARQLPPDHLIDGRAEGLPDDGHCGQADGLVLLRLQPLVRLIQLVAPVVRQRLHQFVVPGGVLHDFGLHLLLLGLVVHFVGVRLLQRQAGALLLRQLLLRAAPHALCDGRLLPGLVGLLLLLLVLLLQLVHLRLQVLDLPLQLLELHLLLQHLLDLMCVHRDSVPRLVCRALVANGVVHGLDPLPHHLLDGGLLLLGLLLLLLLLF
mmetsp:Transcript_110807/g.192069  ORF Transcript_110807/g.192069 Transcript_110807/m.192069 type:complete len:504 (+) Transcript_110807:716-2227(+)